MDTEPPTLSYQPSPGEPLSVAIVNAISEAKGRDITDDQRVLYRNIDPDALEQLFRSDTDDNRITVEFSTHDAIVLLTGNGGLRIDVQDLETDPEYQAV